MRASPGQLLIITTAALAALPAYPQNAPDGGDPYTDVRQVETRLEQLEQRLGPYAADLAEPSAELGLMLLRNGAHADARKAFRRAMQVERVNEGLYTPRQLPFLDLAIESSVAAGDWERVDDDFQYFEWLNYRIHDEQDAAIIDVLDRVIDWHLAAIHLDTEGQKGRHLLRLLDLGERRAALSGQHYGSGHPRHVEHLYALALHFYYVSIAAQRPGPVAETLIEKLTSPIDHRRSFYLAQEALADDCYRKGRQLLERALESARGTPAFTPEAEGAGLVYFADWELMFNHRSRAERLYREAYGTLVSAGISVDRLQGYFGTPALLPMPGFRLTLSPDEVSTSVPAGSAPTPEAIRFVPWAREVPGVQFPVAEIPGSPADGVERYALARFHVEENGWAQNIRIVELHPEDKTLSRHARNAFWYAQFRPRIEEGRVATTRDVEARYLPLE